MTTLHHIGYWVDDLDAAMKRWHRDLGVGPFQVIEHVRFEEFVLTIDGQQHHDVVFDHAAAFAAWGPIVVELNQVHAIDDRLAAALNLTPAALNLTPGALNLTPGALNPTPGALNPTPGAVSHVSWVVPDVGEESARLARLGCRLINTARSGPIEVAWHDGGPLFGHPVELHQHNDVIAGMHARLVALRD
jgi:catechol 2,3-dioxygenase-like lactoylglutathione lyase family enzyme